VKRFSCSELVELVTAYLDRALDEPSRLGFEQHVAHCDGCARYVDQIRVTVAALADLPPAGRAPTALSPATRDRLLAAFRRSRSSCHGSASA
jgi:anti-sigma factor RsiW